MIKKYDKKMDKYSFISIHVLEFLPIKDFKNITKILIKSKVLNKEEIEYITRLRAKKIILRFMRNVVGLIKSSDVLVFQDDFYVENLNHPLVKKIFLYYYFFHTELNWVQNWYIDWENIDWKNEIKNKYIRKTTNDPTIVTRYDLFLLQKQMTLDEILSIGE